MKKKTGNAWKCWLFLGWAPCSLQCKSRKHLKIRVFPWHFPQARWPVLFSPGIVSNERNIAIDSQSQYILGNVIQLKESRRMKRMKIIFCSTSTHLNIESSKYQEFTFTIECQGPYGSCSFLCIGQQPSTFKLCLPAILPNNPASMVKTSATRRVMGWAVGKYLGDPCEFSLGCKDTIRMMSSDFEEKMCHPKRLNLNLPPSWEGKKPRDAGVSALMIIPDQVFATGENGAIWSTCELGCELLKISSHPVAMVQDWNSTVQLCLLCVGWQPLR